MCFLLLLFRRFPHSANMAVVLTESLKFAAATALFARSAAKALTTYLNENKAPPAHQIKGIGLHRPLPETLPSVVDIKRVLPKACFQPKVSTSMAYAVRDFVQIAVAFVVFFYLIESWVTSPIAKVLLMVLYWAIQGTFFTAIFVIGHDCGHGSFSDHALLNDVVGTVWHSFLLAPFYMWKLSHRHHHQNNANIDKDEVFYPVKASEPTANGKTLPGFGFGTGWFGYLLLGYNPRPVNHFNPFDPMFVGHVIGCFFSLAGLGTMSYLLYRFYQAFGLLALINYYVIPDFIFASYCVIITFLHHNEMSIPWFADSQWDFVRGQLSTIDRHYGIVHNVLHSIGTHQMHHMFTKIPHYQLEEATMHFRRAFPELVRTCDEPILPSLMRMWLKYDKQSVIDDDTLVHYYK